MTKYLFIVFLILLASAAVPQLTASNIQQTLKSQHLTVVKFFSPSCGHCVAMAPEYEKLYEESQGKKYKVFQVDCSVQNSVCSHAKIEGYPTVRLYSNGAQINYEGDRTASAIQSWVNAIESASLDLLEAEQAKAKIGVETFVLVGGLSQKDIRSIAIEKINSKFDIKFYALKTTTNFIRLYKKGSEQFQEYTQDDKFPASLISWSFQKGREAVVQLTSELFSYVNQQTEFPYIVVIVDQNDEIAAKAKPILQSWCDGNRHNILCIIADKQNQAYENIKKTAKASEQKTTISFIKSDLSIGYHYTESTVTSESLHQFFVDAQADKIYRSIDQQRELNSKFAYVNIVRLTNQNYNETIANNDYVFVQYYSPRCGHCVRFAQDYEQVATRLKEQNPNVVVAGVDAASESQISQQENIQGYPTFKMFIHGSPIDYPGERSVQDMVSYINKISTSKLLSADCTCKLTRPFIAIRGITQKSHLNILPILYDSHPIYHITGESEFKVEIHIGDEPLTYSGDADVDKIVNWIIYSTSPVLVSLGESKPSNKLQRAIDKKIPLLVVLNKHQREFAAPALSFLEGYCKQQTQFVCGYVHKDEEDYQYLLKWSGDSDKVANRLVWINTEKLTKYLYQGDPNQVTKEALDDFVAGVQEGRISPNKKEQAKAEDTNQEELQEL